MKRGIAAAAIAVIITFLVWSLKGSEHFPIHGVSVVESPAPSTVPSPADLAASPAPSEGADSAIEACLPGTGIATPAEVITRLGTPSKQTTQWENVHYQLTNGERRRVRRERTGTGEYKTQLYGEDEEGLPVPLEGTETPAGKIVFEEHADDLEFPGGVSASVIERDGALIELRMSTPAGLLQCETDDETSRTQCGCAPATR